MNARFRAGIATAGFVLMQCTVVIIGDEPKRLTAAKPVQVGMAAVREPRLYYEVAGDGDVVVLIHGGQLDRRMWDDQFQAFAQKFRVVRYDVRGYGKSEAATRPYSPTGDLCELLGSLAIRKAHLVGLSLGGRIAIDFAIEHPEMVASVTAAGPGLSGFEGWSAENSRRFNELIRTARDRGERAVTELWLQDPLMAPAMENPALAARLRTLAFENAQSWLNNPLLVREANPPAIKRLGEVRAPCLLLVGSRDDADIHAIVRLLETGIPQAKKHVVKGAGHMVNMEKPDEFNRLVLDFLGRQSAKAN